MIYASDLLGSYGDEEISNQTQIVFRVEESPTIVNFKIKESDISDIILDFTGEQTMRFLDILKLFLDDGIVGSTELKLFKGDDALELIIESINEDIIVIQTL